MLALVPQGLLTLRHDLQLACHPDSGLCGEHHSIIGLAHLSTEDTHILSNVELLMDSKPKYCQLPLQQ